MDFMRQLESGYLQVNDLNRMAVDCRVMANKLGLTITWRIKKRTATGLLKYNGHLLWKADYTHELPHMVLCLLYNGVYTELSRREKENRESIIRMRLIEEERARERQVMNMPSWGERNRKL